MANPDKSEFSCCLCNKPVTKPTILPCLHLLCTSCLLDYTSRNKKNSLNSLLLGPNGAYSLPYDHRNALIHNEPQPALHSNLDPVTYNKGCGKFPVGDSYQWLGQARSFSGGIKDGATSPKTPSSPLHIDSQYLNQIPQSQVQRKPERQTQLLKDKDGYHFITDESDANKPRENHGKTDVVYAEVDEGIRGVSSKANAAHKCPTCETWFSLAGLSDMPDSWFMENKQFSEELLRKSGTKNLATRLEDLRNSMTEKCARHPNRTATYLCRSCNVFLCCECQCSYHSDHIKAHTDDLATRGREYLRGIKRHTHDIAEQLRSECEDIEHHARLIPAERTELFEQIAKAHQEAKEMLEQTYQELIGQIDIRFQEEENYLDKLTKCNEHHLTYVGHVANISDAVAQYGNKSNVIKMVEPIANALNKERIADTSLTSKCSIRFISAPRKHIQFLPLLGNTSRVYEPIPRPTSHAPLSNVAKIETPPTEQSAPFSVRGKNENACRVSGLCTRQNNEFLVIDSANKRIKIFYQFGFLRDTKKVGDWSHQWAPRDVATNETGTIAVTDAISRSILLLNPDGNLIGTLGTLADPFGVCFTPNNDIAVTDQGQKLAFIYRPDGKQKQVLRPPNGTIGKPTYITCSDAGDIAVSDPGFRCVHVFSCLGQYLFRIDQSFAGYQIFAETQGIAYDIYGNLLLADPIGRTLAVFDKNCHFQCYLLTDTDTNCVFVTKGGKIIVNTGEYIRTFHVPYRSTRPFSKANDQIRKNQKSSSNKMPNPTSLKDALKSNSLPEFRYANAGNGLSLAVSYDNESNIGESAFETSRDKGSRDIGNENAKVVVKPKIAPKPNLKPFEPYLNMNIHQNKTSSSYGNNRGQMTSKSTNDFSSRFTCADESQYIEVSTSPPPYDSSMRPEFSSISPSHQTTINGHSNSSAQTRRYANVAPKPSDFVAVESSSRFNISADANASDSNYSLASDQTSFQSSEASTSSQGTISRHFNISLPCVTDPQFTAAIDDDDDVFVQRQSAESLNEKPRRSPKSRIPEFMRRARSKSRNRANQQALGPPGLMYELKVKFGLKPKNA